MALKRRPPKRKPMPGYAGSIEQAGSPGNLPPAKSKPQTW